MTNAIRRFEDWIPTKQPKNNHRLRISSSASQRPLVRLVTPACETHRCSNARTLYNCTRDCACPNVFPDKAAGLVVLLRTSTTNGNTPLVGGKTVWYLNPQWLGGAGWWPPQLGERVEAGPLFLIIPCNLP